MLFRSEPIALGAPQMWLKNYVAVSPFEMLKIFQNADFIITDTFHGTIFSEKFNGHFAVLYRESNKNKLGDLVKKIGAENHVITEDVYKRQIVCLKNCTSFICWVMAYLHISLRQWQLSAVP